MYISLQSYEENFTKQHLCTWKKVNVFKMTVLQGCIRLVGQAGKKKRVHRLPGTLSVHNKLSDIESVTCRASRRGFCVYVQFLSLSSAWNLRLTFSKLVV